MKLNEKLKTLRQKKKLTQEDVAKKLNISRQSVSKWERGINEPNLTTIKELCLIYEVSISELLDDCEVGIVLTKEEKQFKIETKLFLFNSAFTLFGILLTFILIRLMQDIIPLHYDFQGQITRYGSKWETLNLIWILLLFYSFSSLFHFYYAKNEPALLKTMIASQIILLISILMMIALNIWMGFNGANNLEADILAFLTSITALLFMVLSIFAFPKINKEINPIFGFRTSFTLTNQEAWEKVNFAQSISGTIFSAIIYLITIMTFKNWNIYLLFGIVISIIPPFIVHEILRKKITQ
ncbi:MAG: helix-turn-helix domain-containing protein [Acholeplasmataceae bacterium]|nr:helix-turn-helix domain-containing protein [Acholeplasmataceae bacterium]